MSTLPTAGGSRAFFSEVTEMKGEGAWRFCWRFEFVRNLETSLNFRYTQGPPKKIDLSDCRNTSGVER